MFRLLCVTAHPDDESGAFGGGLLLYASRGVDTHVICLTAGEAATNMGPTKSRSELAAIRRGEFAAACHILKVSNGEVLGYPDGNLDRVPLATVVADLVCRIRTIRPQVLLTLGSEGAVTGHADHSMASVFGTLAFHWAGRADRCVEQFGAGLSPYRVQKLYHWTADFTLPGRPSVSMPPATAFLDIRDFLEDKIRAYKAHATQAPLFAEFEATMRQHGGKELYHLAATVSSRVVEMETDLFTGITEAS